MDFYLGTIMYFKLKIATLTSISLSGFMFSTPATKIGGALEVFIFVSPPPSIFSSPDSASNLLLFDGDGCCGQ